MLSECEVLELLLGLLFDLPNQLVFFPGVAPVKGAGGRVEDGIELHRDLLSMRLGGVTDQRGAEGVADVDAPIVTWRSMNQQAEHVDDNFVSIFPIYFHLNLLNEAFVLVAEGDCNHEFLKGCTVLMSYLVLFAGILQNRLVFLLYRTPPYALIVARPLTNSDFWLDLLSNYVGVLII